MTQRQHRWYLREWGAAFSAHWAGVRGGEVLARADRPATHPMRDQVLTVARRLLARDGGKLSADALRHACHVVAIGRDVSSMKLTNKQIDQVVAVFRQLAGINLAAMLTTQQSAREGRRMEEGKVRKAADAEAPTPMPDADRKRLIYGIEQVDLPPKYLEELARDIFGTADWRTLPTDKLHKLRITAGCRSISRQLGGIKRVNVAKTL